MTHTSAAQQRGRASGPISDANTPNAFRGGVYYPAARAARLVYDDAMARRNSAAAQAAR